MYLKQSLYKTYSWTELGDIVTNLCDQLSNKRVSGLTSVNTESLILTEILRRKIHFDSKGDVLSVGLDNLTGLPDVVVTKFVHDEEEFQYHVPELFYDMLFVDVENRITKVTFPWE